MTEDVTPSELATLRRKAAWFDAVIDNAPINIYFKNTDGEFLWVNKKFAETFGKAPEEFVGQTASGHLADASSKLASDHDRRVMETGRAEMQEELLQGRIFQVLKCPVFDEQGDVVAILGFDLDVTERRRAEEKLAAHRDELAVLNAQKEKFFSILAHDLRSPANSLLGYAQLLSGGIVDLDWEQVTRFGTAVNQSAEQVVRLLENLLEWSRLQTGGMTFEPGPVELTDVFDANLDMFAPIAARKSIQLSSTNGAAVTALADAHMVDTVVRNLVNNAIKFTPETGRVSLSAQRADGWAEFAVADTGVGISPGDLDRIFRLDEKVTSSGTAGETGTGLGLPLCKELVEKQGGRLVVESDQGTGSTFRVQLPLFEA